MNRRELIERVAAGLRRLPVTPDAMLFLDFERRDDATWDEPEILGIPVFHATSLKNLEAEGMSEAGVFVPIFSKDNENNGVWAHQFCQGFDEWGEE